MRRAPRAAACKHPPPHSHPPHPDSNESNKKTWPPQGDTSSEYLWVVDPLDGTTNFAHGYPCFRYAHASGGGTMHKRRRRRRRRRRAGGMAERRGQGGGG